MLNENQRSQLEKVLLEERERLMRAAKDGLKFSMERERSIGRDSIDESMEEELFSTELRLRDREKYLLNKINAALDRLEKRTIDECEDCGETISFRRLLARPVTTLCIDCKEEKEKEELSKHQIVGRGSVSSDEPISDHADDE
ncbi:MAG TPA: TraR/DksA C4-type zinc finger protein [Pseudomonadota bacterium]|jgi:DnaK suppressor protein|nr:TraR/DksA C4-type zinc finger protein [Pseudomonadota bacterium]